MPLKLAKLPERTPVKLTISMQPDLSQALSEYADVYREQYGQSESVANLIPHMLRAFLDSDRGFAKTRQSGRTS